MTTHEKIADIIGYHMAALVSGNNQPDMSGDPRARLHAHVRRRFDDACREAAEKIVAGLSALVPDEAAGLVERLEKRAKTMNGASPVGAGDGNTYALGYYDQFAAKDDLEAASLIQSQAAMIASLKAALKPFSLAAAVYDYDPPIYSDDDKSDSSLERSPLRVGDFRLAFALLNGERKG